MNTIVQVVSNVKHNGVAYEKGTVMVLDSGMHQLLSEGLLREIKGVSTVEEGMAIVGQEVAATAEEKEDVVASSDTWGAQPDPKPEAEKAPETEVKDAEPSAPATDTTTAPVAPVEGDTAPTAPADDKKDEDDGLNGKDL